MSDGSDIEWTDATWNPTRGCTKVSPGCKHCYAEAFAERFRGVEGHPYEHGFDPMLVPEKLSVPLQWVRARRIFVNSMSDLFGEFVPADYIAACFGVMASTPRHTYQILTKRAERMVEWFRWIEADGAPVSRCAIEAANRVDVDHLALPWPLPNAHLGVSVEDRRFGLPRIDALRRVPAVLRFLSIEPLLEELGEVDLAGIGWVIIGGESGPGARPCNLAWIRCIVEQADSADVPVFVKQLGSRPEGRGAPALAQLRTKKTRKGGDMLTWPADLAGRRAFPRIGGGAS